MTDAQIDILKTSMDWAKAEMLSSVFFALFGVAFLVASYCFWQLAKTDTAKAYVIPFMVVGVLLVILGVGLVIANQIRFSNFPIAYAADAQAFLNAEIARADKTINGYNNAVFKFIPLIIIICAAVLMFVKSPIWQASMVATIAMMAIILLVDTSANTRHQAFKAKLVQAEQAY